MAGTSPAMTVATKNAASPPCFFVFAFAARLKPAAALQSRIRIGARARLAGRRHGRGARAGRLQHRLAVRLLAVEQVDDLIAGQPLELQQALGQGFEVGALFGQDAGGFVVAFLDEAPDFLRPS
jgi:hypothetical protein